MSNKNQDWLDLNDQKEKICICNYHNEIRAKYCIMCGRKLVV